MSHERRLLRAAHPRPLAVRAGGLPDADGRSGVAVVTPARFFDLFWRRLAMSLFGWWFLLGLALTFWFFSLLRPFRLGLHHELSIALGVMRAEWNGESP